ncbi:MAG: N-formylglutamate amidohydrolase [Desulfuromonadales bacterium]
MAESGWSLLLSCEHGGNQVPEPWRQIFQGHEQMLQSHRGYDIGIAAFARWLAGQLQAPLHLAEVTRLLVELNRSPGHPALFSEFSRVLGPSERKRLLESYYHPYREAVIRHIAQLLQTSERVCHVSLHSFTPELNGVVRNADIGLLYDPQRSREKSFCLRWKSILDSCPGNWKVRRNYPYRGCADSLVKQLRRRYTEERYLGIELELNQRWPLLGGERWQNLQHDVRDTLQAALV